MTQSLANAVAELGALPDTDAVAARLLQDGACGKRYSGYVCPVALWLQRASGIKSLVVGTVEIATDIVMDLPPVLKKFTLAFDHGDYPDLEIG